MESEGSSGVVGVLDAFPANLGNVEIGVVFDVEEASAMGTEEPFLAAAGKEVAIKFFYVDGDGADCLHAIEGEEDVMGAAEGGDLFDGVALAGDVGDDGKGDEADMGEVGVEEFGDV